MSKRQDELNEEVKNLPFNVQNELTDAKAKNGCFGAFEEAQKAIDDLLKHECSLLEAKYEVNKVIERMYNEAFYEGALVGFSKAKE